MVFTEFVYTSLPVLSIIPYTIQYPPTLQCPRRLILSLFQSYLSFPQLVSLQLKLTYRGF